jgi:Ca2+-transporting ATPase
MLRTSVILAISAIPEGLLIAVTVILVLGMRKILKRQGLVKKLLAVETLGSVNVICTDKTGTLTEGRMRVTRTDFVDNERAIQIMVLCNNLEGPVEMALWEYAKSRLPNDPQTLVEESQRLDEEIFTSETKFMITGHHLPDGDYHFLKGAPEIVLKMCQINDDERQRILAQIDQWAGEGLRLLGLAYRDYGILEDHTGYTWVGLIGMEDPIREGVHEAVLLAKHAGIQVKMITGDYRRTAERIASNIGLLQNGEETLEGEELAQLNDEELAKRIYPTAVFARIRPHDKLRIVNALQKHGDITAMIGDGVNDAPALKQANIGVVVGTASDVAKETADLILLDNNFRTIVAAIEEGRVIFENIRKVVAYVLSNSFAEVLTIFISMILGWPAPLLVAQILWIHLICDGPADIVLGFEPKENGIMDEKPKSLKEPILPPLGLFLIGVISIGSALAALLIFGHYFKIHGDADEGRSLVFASLAINSLIYIFAYRSMRKSLFKMNSILKNKPLIFAVIFGMVLVFLPFVIPSLSQALDVVPLDLKQWLLIFTIALMLLIAVEIGKAVSNWWHNKKIL